MLCKVGLSERGFYHLVIVNKDTTTIVVGSKKQIDFDNIPGMEKSHSNILKTPRKQYSSAKIVTGLATSVVFSFPPTLCTLQSPSILNGLSHPLKLTAAEKIVYNSRSIGDLIGPVLTENKAYKGLDSIRYTKIIDLASLDLGIDRLEFIANTSVQPNQKPSRAARAGIICV
eukprot:scaffold17322_cov117-Skeletonema_marinoi.AAC.3